MKMNFINNAITTNANNKGVIWLVFSLFFISIFLGTSITLSQISLKQQRAFLASSNQMKLKNQSKLADYIIDRSIDDVLKNLAINSSTPNIAFVDRSTGSNIVKKNPTYLSINTNNQIYSTDPNTGISSLVKAPGVQGNFVINSPNKTNIKGNTISYTFSITSTVNNIINGVNNFESSSITVNKSISCPAPSNGQGSMRVLNSSELSSLSPPASSFPSVYCTCSDSGFPKTGADGSCTTNVSCTRASIPNCETCSTTVANTCGGCNAGYYLSSTNNCLLCPTTGVASCPTNSMFTCSSGYYLNLSTSSCLLCTSKIGVATCDANTGLPITCQAGYQLVGNSCNPCLPGTYNPNVGTSACTSCSSGYYTSTSGQTACNTPCSNLGAGVASCSNIGVVTGCNTGYSLLNGACIKCPDGTFLSGGSCISCFLYSTGGSGIQGCATCTSYFDCTSCIPGYVLSKSIISIQNINTTFCMPCTNNCATCSGGKK